MKKLISLLVALPLILLAETSTPKGFTDNLDEAMATAKKDGKLIYVCFSGSDWCYWCQKLDAEVFATGEFAEQVKNDYICVFIDSPRNKKLLSDHARTNNPKIRRKFGVNAFPSGFVLDPADGEIIADVYCSGGKPASFAKRLKKIRKNPQARKARYQARRIKKAEAARKRAEEKKRLAEEKRRKAAEEAQKASEQAAKPTVPVNPVKE